MWAIHPPNLVPHAQGLEKYLLVKLYDRTFGVEPADRERDEVISTRMRALQVGAAQAPHRGHRPQKT
jgi:hypothetical protein